ncbi:MAG: hypothetical protein IKP10_01150 [Clostridia bacterium]|nr:hypothetical protein [Clostridia bacterium]
MRDGSDLLRESAMRAARLDAAVPGRFLPAADAGQAIHEAREAGVLVSFDGGYPEAERVQACFHPEGMEAVFTRVWVTVTWNPRAAAPEHRALMGSLMALGTDRSYIGDLIAEENGAYLCCLPPLAARLPLEWTEAGRTAIRAETTDEPPVITPPKGLTVRDTVASLRLDSLLAAALRLSRGTAADMIRAGGVSVRHRPEERIDRVIQPGDVISIRGRGRVILREVLDPNRRDRYPVVFETFLHPANRH